MDSPRPGVPHHAAAGRQGARARMRRLSKISLPILVGAVLLFAVLYRSAIELRILAHSDDQPLSRKIEQPAKPLVSPQPPPPPPPPLSTRPPTNSKATFPPLRSVASDACVLSCCNPRSVHELALEEELVRMLSMRKHRHAVITLATNGTLAALRIHAESMKRNAPTSFESLIIGCIGRDVYEICSRAWPEKCVHDIELSSKLRAFSVDGKSRSMVVSRDYVDIVWRKPEICKLALLAGAEGCLIVDSDGVWFRDPLPEESTAATVLWSSSDYVERASRPVHGCDRAKLRSVTNSGTVWIPNNAFGNAVLDRWLASRVKDPLGLCNPTVLEGDAMLDQDGLNVAVCEGPSGSMIYSSMQVLLNSVHAQVRSYKEYSICKPFFFHATNCGATHEKAKCLQRNLGRWAGGGCGNFSAQAWGLDKPWP